jgi:hypothetical protein
MFFTLIRTLPVLLPVEDVAVELDLERDVEGVLVVGVLLADQLRDRRPRPSRWGSVYSTNALAWTCGMPGARILPFGG